MTALFVALGIAVLTLLALLLWFVPHLLQQQALRSASEAAQLREMLLDLLNEQEAVTMRQAQLGTSISYLQDQLEQAVHTNTRAEAPAWADKAAIRQLEERLSTLQSQIQGWMDGQSGVGKSRVEQDNASWAYLLSLLSVIQERVGSLSNERAGAAATLHAGALIEELEREMENLRSISEDISTLQWRLRRSLHDREAGLSTMRPSKSNTAT